VARFPQLLVLLLPLSAAMAASSVPSETLLDRGYRQMYNLDFSQAHRTFSEWQLQHPDDPLGPVSDAACYLFSEFDRLHILQSEFFLHDENFRIKERLAPNPAIQNSFHTQLAKADDLAARALARSPNDSNALFAKVLVLGLRSDYDALIEKRYLSSLAATKDGRLTAEHLLAIDPQCYDAWLAIGVENYLLSLKPLPLRWLLQLGGNATDGEFGRQKLQITAAKGRYLRPFARLLLAVAALRDKNIEQGKSILRELSAEFPGNRLYTEELARLQ
jgi:hypothetical protein